MKLRAGVVGAGNIGKFHVQGLRRLPGVEIVGVTDLHADRARQFGKDMAVPVYPSIAALHAAGARIVHVVTPPASHAAVAIEAMALGCDVLIEKPMATSIEDCERIERAALRYGRTVCVGHSLLYDPFIRRAIDLVHEGAIGEVVTFDYFRSMNPQGYSTAGVSADQQRGGYPFRDIGIHALYLAEAFIGTLHQVEAWPTASGRGDCNLWVDEWRVMARGERATAQIQLSWNIRPQQNVVVIQGTKGIIRADLFGLSVTLKRAHGLPEPATRMVNALNEGRGIATQALGNVVRVARKRLWQFHGVQALIAAFYESLAKGQPAPVTPADAKRVVFWTEHVANLGDAMKTEWEARITAHESGAQILVTGGGGFIGSELVKRLLADGQRIRLFLRRAPAPAVLNHPNVDVVLGDLGDTAAVRRAVSGAHTVFHLGAAMRGGGPEFERSTVTGTRNIVDSCVESGVRQLVYMSSLAVIDTDAGPTVTESTATERKPQERGHYTKAKLEAERIVLDAVATRGLRAVLLRPGEVVGPEKPLLTSGVAQSVGRNLIVIGDGRVRLPLVHVSDVVDALIAAADRKIDDGSIIQLVEDVEITQNDIIADYLTSTGEVRRVIRLPLRAVLALSSVLEFATARLMGRALIGPRRIRAATASRRFDCSVARRLLDWQPRVGVAAAFSGQTRSDARPGQPASDSQAAVA